MKTIITAGKGGTGKTTILYYLLTRHILLRSERILIVDADPHQSLTSLLWAGQIVTLGDMRHVHAEPLRTGAGLDETTSRREYALQLTQSALRLLTPNADLLVMGRNDQPGCQCVVNGLLGDALDALAGQYDLVIVDNEAGIEHIGRHGWAVDVALLTTCLNPLEYDVSCKIVQHARECNRIVRNWCVIFNHARPTSSLKWVDRMKTVFSDDGVMVLGTMPFFEGSEPSSNEWFRMLGLFWRQITYLAGLRDYVPAMVSRSQLAD